MFRRYKSKKDFKCFAQLTDDQLEIINGKVFIQSHGEGNKTSGTELIRYLIEQTDKKITIKLIPEDGKNNSNCIAQKVDEFSVEDDLFNGKGLNSIIFGSLGEIILPEIDEEGNISNNKTPGFISLGHELIHAFHNAAGMNKGYIAYGQYFGMEEEFFTKFDSKISENTLRRENNLNARAK